MYLLPLWEYYQAIKDIDKALAIRPDYATTLENKNKILDKNINQFLFVILVTDVVSSFSYSYISYSVLY